MEKWSLIFMIMAVGVSLAFLPVPGQAGMLDLTGLNSIVTSNGAYFYQVDPTPTGTGNIDSFMKFDVGGNTDIETGYNTSARPVPADSHGTNALNFNYNLELAAVPIVNLGGVNYREFLLDVNQSKPNADLSLDVLEVWVSNTASPTSYPNLGTKIYNLAPTDWILLDYSLNNGSGSGDMFAYIRSSLFDNYTYVYLYSSFGNQDGHINTDGFEEWAVRTPAPAVPEPATMLLLGSGLIGLAGFARKKFKK